MHRICLEGHTELASLVASRKRNRERQEGDFSLFTLLLCATYLYCVIYQKYVDRPLPLALPWLIVHLDFFVFPSLFPCDVRVPLSSYPTVTHSLETPYWLTTPWGWLWSLQPDLWSPEFPFWNVHYPVQTDSSSFLWKINSCVPIKKFTL